MMMNNIMYNPAINNDIQAFIKEEEYDVMTNKIMFNPAIHNDILDSIKEEKEEYELMMILSSSLIS